jgi:2-isopropylmalate synthase
MQRNFSGNGADDDIVVSSARAYVSALNKLIAFIAASNARPNARASVTASVDDGSAGGSAIGGATLVGAA